MAHTFAAFGKNIKLWEEKSSGMRGYQQILWGDWLEIDENRQEKDGYLPIIWAKKNDEKRKELWVKKSETTDTRPLEIIFVDVGQGDGCVLITPEKNDDERIIVIDAGERRHMHEFLKKRFENYREFDFHAAILTHPDKDHYGGFKDIFNDQNIGFKHLYHNGLMELPVTGTSKFEKVEGTSLDPVSGITFVSRLWQTNDEVEADFDDNSNFEQFKFPPMIHAALKNPNIGPIEMVSTEHGTKVGGRTYLPGFAPDDGKGYDVEILGPFVEFDSNNKPRLRKISSYGKTKNGHSILLRLTFGNYKIFFGGDLNQQAERFLLSKYTGREDIPRHSGPVYDAIVAKARERFRSEIMKCCHHGAADVTDIFLDSVNPACFVISSGEDHGHVHPRPDLLGRLGRFGRGESPVLLSTELQRSTRENEDEKKVAELLKDVANLRTNPTDNLKDKIDTCINELARTNVDVYGAIYVKTDGKRLITAFKKETKKEKWFFFEYQIDPAGVLTVID